MNKIIIFLILIFSIRGSAQQAQKLSKFDNYKYRYGDRVDKLHSFEDLFQNDKRSKLLFDRFNKARKAQSTANIIAPTVFLGSTLLARTASCEDLGCLGLAYLWMGVNAIGVTYAIVANINSGTKKTKAKKELLLHFNELEVDDDSNHIDQQPSFGMTQAPSLNFILSSKGIGIAYTF